MKKILILMVFAIMFIACGDNSVSPEPTYTQPVQQPTYSSASTYIPPTNTQSYISSNVQYETISEEFEEIYQKLNKNE